MGLAACLGCVWGAILDSHAVWATYKDVQGERVQVCAKVKTLCHACKSTKCSQTRLTTRSLWPATPQEALAQGPDCTLLSMLLCHVYVVAGKLRAAASTAQAAAAASPHDMDAHMLLALIQGLVIEWDEEGGLLGSQPANQRPQSAAQQQQGMTSRVEAYSSASLEDPVHVEVHAHLVALHADPTGSLALQGVCNRAGHCPECSVASVDACLTYLDMLGVLPSLQREAQALSTLCTALCSLGQSFVAACRADDPEDGGGAGQGVGGSGAGGAGAPAAQPAAQQASVARWCRVRGMLHDRAYWWPAAAFALRPPGSSANSRAGAGAKQTDADARQGGAGAPSVSNTGVGKGGAGKRGRVEEADEQQPQQQQEDGASQCGMDEQELWVIVAAFMLGPRHAYVTAATVATAKPAEPSMGGARTDGKRKKAKRGRRSPTKDSSSSSSDSDDEASGDDKEGAVQGKKSKLQAALDTATKVWWAEHARARPAPPAPNNNNDLQLPDIPEDTDPAHVRTAHEAWRGAPVTWSQMQMPLAAQLVFPAKRRELRRVAAG